MEAYEKSMYCEKSRNQLNIPLSNISSLVDFSINVSKARFFLLVDLGDFFSNLGSESSENDQSKKSSENDQEKKL